MSVETTIPEGRVIFLLGAGASKDAGFPLVDGLTYELRKCLPYVTGLNGEIRDEFPELFDAVAHLDPEAKKNYERFFACLELMTPRLEKPSQKLTSLNLEERLAKAAPDLMFSIATPIVKELRRCHLDYHPDYLKGLIEFVPPADRLKVFTLNYDLCVEKALQNLGMDVTTGFSRTTGRWTPELFGNGGRGINLYKLHGSLNWIYDDNLENQQLTEDYSSPLENPPEWGRGPQLVLGPGNKLQFDDPFVTLYYEFHQALKQAKVCVTIGFSFGDNHITVPLIQAKQRGLAIVDVRPNAIGGEGHNPIQSNAKEAFESCEIWRIVYQHLVDAMP